MGNSDFSVLIKAVLDASGIGKSDISEVQKVLNKYTLNLTTELNKTELLKSVKTIVPELEAELKKITGIDIKISDDSIFKAINQVYKENANSAKQAAKEQESLVNAMAKGREQAELARRTEEKRQQQAQNNAINKSLEQEYLLREKIVKSANDAINNGTVNRNVSDISLQYSKLSNVTDELKTDFTELKKLQDALGTSQTDEELIDNYNKFNDTLLKVKNTITVLNNEQKQLTSSGSIDVSKKRISNLANSVLAFKTNNSKMSKDVSNSLDQMYSRLISGAKISEKEIAELEDRFASLKLEVRASGDLGKSFGGKLKDNIENFMSWGFATGLTTEVIQTARKMYDAVYDIDTAMTELDKVSDATLLELNNALEKSTETAKTYGATVSDVVNATADWSRLGYNLPDAEYLAEVATIYKNVGDGIDIDTANQSLVSTLQGFQLEADEALSIIDKFNEVANNFPIDTAGIGEALQRSAASFYAANTDLSKSIALITGTNSVVQDPDSVGTMWKTVSMRIRGTKQELEEAGEETDGMVESTAQLRELIQGLTGFDIMVDEAGTQFKDIYDIVVGIGHEWKNLTDVEQAGLLETLAGKRQGNALSAALNNIDLIEEAYHTAENSAGSAMKEQETYLSSLEAKTQQFSAAFQSLSNTVLDSSVPKFFVDLGTTGVSALDSVIDKFGTLNTLATAGGGFLGAKNLGWQKHIDVKLCEAQYIPRAKVRILWVKH